MLTINGYAYTGKEKEEIERRIKIGFRHEDEVFIKKTIQIAATRKRILGTYHGDLTEEEVAYSISTFPFGGRCYLQDGKFTITEYTD